MSTRTPYNKERSAGFGLVEIIIVGAIVTTAFFAFLEAGTAAIKLLRLEQENLEATLLADEGLEAVRAVRNASWAGAIAPLVNGVTYYPVIESGVWKLSTTDPGPIDGVYTRTVVFSQVLRDALDRIAPAGTPDSSTRRVVSRVTWGSGKQTELTAYITDFQGALGGASETKAVSFEDVPLDLNLASFPSANAGDGDPAQSFTTTSAITASKVELPLRRQTASPSNVFVELRTGPTGAILGTSNVIPAATIPATVSWVEFRFIPAVALGASTVYWIRLRSVPDSTVLGSGSTGELRWAYNESGSDPYAAGAARRFIGRLSNPTDQGELLNNDDFGFKVYAR